MDSSVLSDVLKNLQSLCGANGAIFGYAQDLLIPLMTIDFVVVFIMQVFGSAQMLSELLKVDVMNKQQDIDRSNQVSKMASTFIDSAKNKNTKITNKGESLPVFRSH